MKLFSLILRQERENGHDRPPVSKILRIMKLTILMLFSFTVGAFASGSAQTVTLSMKNTRLENVLEEISKQTKLHFFYDQQLLADLKPVSLAISNGKVDQVLNRAFKGQNLTFQILDGTIVISEKKRTDIEVTGTVRDSLGILAGVTVSVEGVGDISTKTDENGRYSLRVPDNAVLVFRFMGYTTQYVSVDNQKIIDVRMEVEASALDEIIVVGFGTQKKINLTGAIDQISAAEIENRPVTNLGAALQGLIPNLNITNPSGNPSQGANFNIRGITSINGGDPLILVDNIPYTADEVARLNPNDFETVTVLKDASSAAIYGARAAFGVVLITTKSAKSEKAQIAISTNTQFRSVGKLPEVVRDPLTVMEYKHNAALPLYNLFPENVREYARRMQDDPSLPNVIVDPNNPNSYLYYGSTDWMQEAYNKMAPTYNLQTTVGKASDGLSYLFSGEYYRQDGMLKYGNDKLDRYNVRGKVDVRLNRWLTLGTNTLITSRKYDAPVFMDDLFFWEVNRKSTLDVIRNPDGSWTQSGGSLLGRMQEGGRRNQGINEFQTTLSLKADLIKDMWDLNADATFRRSNAVVDSYDVPVYYTTGPNTAPQVTGSAIPWAAKENGNVRYDVVNIYSNFRKNFDDHHLSALLGYNQEYRKEESIFSRQNGLYSPSLPNPGLAHGEKLIQTGYDDWALQGVFYRLNYDYQDKYLVEFNGRYDGSSRFPEGDRWGFFPSISAGWVVSEENFFAGAKSVVNFFKLRGSYGSLGNQMVYDPAGNLLSYPYIPFMSPYNVPRVLNGQRPVSLNPPAAVAKSLTWEDVTTINGGIDLYLFSNRLGMTYDMYSRRTEGMLVMGTKLPSVFGTGSPIFNSADLKTNGWELRLNWKDQFDLGGSPFNYNLTFTLANSRTYITKYHNPAGLLANYYEGQRYGEIWGLQFDGFFQNEEELAAIDQSAAGTDDQGYKFYVGDIRFKDQNGDGKVDFGSRTLNDHGDMVKLGNSTLQYPYSFDVSGSWKGVDLHMFFQGIGKRDWYPPAAYIYFWGVYAQPWTNVTKQNLDHWSPDNPNGYFPRTKAYTAEDDMQELGIPNDRYMQNAAYLRMKNITVGYTLPSRWLRNSGLSSVRFYFSGENLFERSKIKVALDPESISHDWPPGAIYPFQRTYSFGVNVKF